jgi:Tfp pilus assembly protein PilN
MNGHVESERVVRKIWIGGFNLLPHRQREARLARKRRVLEWSGAAVCGCVGVGLLIGWLAFEQARIEAERSIVERTLGTLSRPLAEYTHLTNDAKNERLQNARAASLSEPLSHLLELLDAMSRESVDEVVVRQLRHREHETELLAVSTDHAASAAWLNRLSAVRGVKDADLTDLHPVSGASPDQRGAVELTAHLKWNGPPEKKAAASLRDNSNTKGAK